jgi:hypothetical protein
VHNDVIGLPHELRELFYLRRQQSSCISLFGRTTDALAVARG